MLGTVVARPGLFERLGGPAQVTVVTAPAGSGKTVLLRSWLGQAGLDGQAAWVSAGHGERDPQRFWVSVASALRRTSGGAGVQSVSAAPDLDGWAVGERLLEDLVQVDGRLWLVIDDMHELGSSEALRQLELLIMRAPPRLRFVLATRHDVRLGLHRLRLEGQLAEIRAGDLKFTQAEAGELLAAAGVALPDSALAALHERTEGWAAGLRLAALSLAGHPDPERFATEFSGGERTVAEYLVAEVLDRQPKEARRLLLRTSVLDRVNGALSRLLTGDDGGERVLQDLERANAFVVSLDAERSWFRYHQMFADLLRLELRRAAPTEVAGLHGSAAGWFAEHGFPVEAIGHAQAAGDWDLATQVLAAHWPGLYLDGQHAVVHELLAGFPPGAASADAELAAAAAADELTKGSIEGAERFLGLAERGTASVPEARRAQARLLLGVVRLLVARQRADLSAATAEAARLQAMTEAPDLATPGLSADLRALALVSLGATEVWAGRLADAERHLDQGIALSRAIGRPFLVFTGLVWQGSQQAFRSFPRAVALGQEAVGLAEKHGWTDEPAAGIAYQLLGAVLTWQGRPEEAEPWVRRAERALRAEADPAGVMGVRYVRGLLELVRGRDAETLAAFRASERVARRLTAPDLVVPRARALLVLALARRGETERAEEVLAGLAGQDREHGEIRIATAAVRLAQGDPRAATVALAPVLDGVALVNPSRAMRILAFVLAASARDALGDPAAAWRALEHALDLAEPDGTFSPFLLHPVDDLLERHARQRTAHAALVAEIRGLLGDGARVPAAGSLPLLEALSESEIRVLRYLPTNLSAPEIARELSVSPNTVKTHVRHLYDKLGTHGRAEAVARARGLGLLAPAGTRSASRLGGQGVVPA